jgi:hypothetical protein
MNKRKQVLIVTNAITEEEVLQIRNAIKTKYTPKMNIQLSLVHVIPRLPVCYFSIPSVGILIDKYQNEAQKSLDCIGKLLGIAKKDQWMISGKLRTEILRLATQLGSSFILAGSQQIQELQRSLFFKNVHQYAMVKNIKHLEKL